MENHQQNIEIVKKVYEAFARRDINSILDLLSSEVEWGEPENPFNPAAGTRYGHKGFLEWSNIGQEAEEILELELKKFLADDDTVAVVGYTKCLAKPTGKIYETDFVNLVTLNNGKVIRFREFFDAYAAGEAFKK